MKVIADLHSHSKYSRAVSPLMTLPIISVWAKRKGIDLVATGDWTQPLWLKELEAQLEEVGEGLYRLKGWEVSSESGSGGAQLTTRPTTHNTPLFLLSTEVAAIYSQGGKQRRIHLLIFVPNFTAVRKINRELTRLGANLFSDGRPILGMSAQDVAKIVLGADPRCLIIPAHAWTPWFSLYGSMSGFDSIEECFGDLSKYIYGIETGLSSDPAMNWRISDLDNRAILSFSDAHSPAKLGREMTVFEVSNQSLELSYELIRKAIIQPSSNNQAPNSKIAYTIEFYPEEGKYHYTGHRSCGVRQTPEETKKLGVRCPRCGRGLTVGVMHRVEQLAKISNVKYQMSNDQYGVRWIKPPTGRPHYVMLVPLLEILAESLGSLVSSQKVIIEYKKLTDGCENEVKVLLQTKPEEIEKLSGLKTREAIEKVRRGDIFVEPGFDGEYGKVRIWDASPDERASRGGEEKQMGLF